MILTNGVHVSMFFCLFILLYLKSPNSVYFLHLEIEDVI
jgi:hypothetical protein